MMKKIFLAIALFIGYFSIAQLPNGLPQKFSGRWYQFERYVTVDSLFGLPVRDTNFTAFRAGVLVTRPSDSLVYRSTGRASGKKWDLVGTGGSFGVYSAGNGLSLSGSTFLADTSSVGLATRNRVKKVADSLGALINGSVPTSTAVTTSFGLEGGGTLATSLSLEADTLQLSTRAWRQKGVDSVRSLLSNYVLLTRNVTTGYGLSGGGNLTTDRVFIADTLALSSRGWRQKLADSLGGVIASITPDTLTLSTKAWRQKGLDSLLFANNSWNGKQTFLDSSFGIYQRVTGNLWVNSANTTGRGLILSDDGGIFDYNTGFIGIASDYGVHIFSNKTGSTPVITLTNGGAISADGNITANSFIKSGGTSSQLLAADGSVVTAGTGVTISGGTISASVVDTVTLSTRAWRQKGVDSVISVLGSRVSGTTNTLPVFTSSTTLGNSALSQTSTTMTLASRKLNITLPTDTSIVGTLVGTGTNVGAQWVFKNDYNTTGGFVGIAAGETSGDMVLAVGANKKLVFGLGTSGNSRGAEFSENALKIFQAAGNTSNWVTLGSLTGTQTWLFGGVTSTTGLTLRTTEYVNVTINGTAYKFALVN